ncbi:MULTISPECIES: hypothetical protein, partial [unclassified Frankia]|uniref:hypothetical protein n=1 Tax=unclassified Frankia TaxID=2632575 RepID=UPI002AD4962F
AGSTPATSSRIAAGPARISDCDMRSSFLAFAYCAAAGGTKNTIAPPPAAMAYCAAAGGTKSIPEFQQHGPSRG